MIRPLFRFLGPIVRNCRSPRRRGFTLIEALVAVALTLVLMGAVVKMFGDLGSSISDSRSVLEMNDRLRAAAARLQVDLSNVTAQMMPPESNGGYFELSRTGGGAMAGDATTNDTTGILIFTARASGQPFRGRSQFTADGTIQSDVAEIAWFVRGNVLYRRVLLVAPSAVPTNASPAGFYANNDISVRQLNGKLIGNTLTDLTRPECRFAHDTSNYPFNARGWGSYGLPTLGDCSAPTWSAGGEKPTAGTGGQTEYWGPCQVGNIKGPGPREAEDVILTNVLGFDVRGWVPTENNYTGIGGYDTWTTQYEALFGTAGNGLDDNGNNVVDDGSERNIPSTVVMPLRGLQVKIRCFERDSRQIREVTVIQDFLPK